MVCVEELCSIFKNLHPHRRIELMCGLLQCCVPLELRFIGSYVENLGRRDFHYLREYELKANSCPEINKLFEASEDVIRHKLAVYLSLLHTSNTTCSKLCFDLLISLKLNTYLIPTYASPCKKANVDVMLELLTVLVMGINHPAFTFEQRIRLFEIYSWLKARTESLFPISMDKDNPPRADPVFAYVSPPESAFTSPDEPMMYRGHMETLIAPVDPMCHPSVLPVLSREPQLDIADPHVHVHPQTDPTLSSPAGSCIHSPNEPLHVLHSPNRSRSTMDGSWPVVEVGQSPSQSDNPLHCQLPEKVFIKRVEVKGSRRTDRKQEFRLEVTWSNGETCDVYKSYQELYEFHTKLVQLFPEDASVHRQDRKLPFLSGNPHGSSKEDKIDQTPQTITNYFRKLVSLQHDILGCDHVIQFFREYPASYLTTPAEPLYKDAGCPVSMAHSEPQVTGSHHLHTIIVSPRQSPPSEIAVSSPLSQTSNNPSEPQKSSPVSAQKSPNRSTHRPPSPGTPPQMKQSQTSPNQSAQTSRSLVSGLNPNESVLPSRVPLSPPLSPNQSMQTSHTPLSPQMSPNQSMQTSRTPLSPQMSPNQSLQTDHALESPLMSPNAPAHTSLSDLPQDHERLPTIQQLLEDLQLSHHGDSFSKYTTGQLLDFKDDDFKVFNLSSHGQKRLKTKLEQLSRTPKLPNGVTVESAMHFNLAGGGGVMPHPSGEQALVPAMLYTSTACIGQLTGGDMGKSGLPSSSRASAKPPCQSTVLSKNPNCEDITTKPEKLSNRGSLQNTASVWETGIANDGDICDRPEFGPVDNSKFESSGQSDQRRFLDSSRVVVLSSHPKAGSALPAPVSGPQCEEEEILEQESVPNPAILSQDGRTQAPADIPHMYQSGYVSDPTHSYPPRPAFARLFPPMYPVGPPQPAHLPLHMYHKVAPDQIPTKISGQYMQSFMQPPHSRSDTPLSNTIMTVTVNSLAYNPSESCPGHPHHGTVSSPAPIPSTSNLNRTVPVGNPVTPRFAMSSSMNSAMPYSSITPIGPPHVHRKAVSAQNSNSDSGMSSPATSVDGVSYVTTQQISTSVGSTSPYSPSAIQASVMAMHSACSSCGCRGRCQATPSYSAAYGGYVHTQVNMPPLVHIPTFLPPNSNGILPSPCLPPNCPIPFHNNPMQSVPNGIIPEQFSYHMSHAATHAPNLWNSMLYGYNSHGTNSGPRENKAKLTCYNCGGAGHEAHDCRDTSMESASGQYSLNFKPDFPE